MKKLLIGVSAAAMSLASIGAAQANHTVAGALNPGLLSHMATFNEGNWVNIAINTGAIDASVNLDGDLNIQVSGTDGGSTHPGADFNNPSAVFGGSGAAQHLASGQVQFGSIDTTAVGVVAEQHIATGSLTIDDLDEFMASDTASSSGASTESTAAAAAFSETSVSFDAFFLNAPSDDTFVANIAFNPSDIDASVSINGSHIEGAAEGTIKTLAAGVVATQTLSHGFDGSAFHSEE